MHKSNVTVRFLTTGCNTVIANLAIFVEKHCAKLNENIPTKINAKGIPDNTILVSFDTVNMLHSIDNNRGAAAVKSVLDSRTYLCLSTECIFEALEICLTNNNSTFACQNLIQTNGTQWGQLIPKNSGNSANRLCYNRRTGDNFSRNILF